MNDLIQRLVNAIFRQEGMPLSDRNPGNLRAAPWLPAGRVSIVSRMSSPSSGGFWFPDSRAEGIAGAAHVVSLHIAEGNSLRQLISIWAPPSDNNDTEAYIKNVKEWAQIPDANAPLWEYIL